MIADYPLIDADGHYYEPDDCFSRHIEAKFKDATVRVERTPNDDLGRVFIGENRTFMSVMPGDYASAPGALQGLFMGEVAEGFDHREVINARDYPAFTDAGARKALMDDQGVEATIMLPTLAVAVEQDMSHDVELTYASLRAFNRWLLEDWGFGADGRLFGVPMISLIDLDEACKELQRVAAEGAKLIHIRPGPFAGRSPAIPHFDPFWAQVVEADISVVFHVSNSGYNKLFGTYWSEDGNAPSHMQSPVQWALCNTERPIVDMLMVLTLQNLFGRHPGLRILSIENGSAWLAPLMKTIDKAAALGRRGTMIGGKLSDKPSRDLVEHLYVSPFPEDDVHALMATVGSGHVLFGSDYPHPEGLRAPRDYLRQLDGVDDATARAVLRTNTAQLLGIRDGALAQTA